jgi:preprotein translocase subunit YajC
MIELLQAAPPAGPGGAAGGLVQFLPMIFIFVIFYFLLIAPMRKKQRKTQEMLATLEKGQEVITTGGIFGRIKAFDEQNSAVVLEISDNTKIRVLRSAIAGKVGETETTTAPSGT